MSQLGWSLAIILSPSLRLRSHVNGRLVLTLRISGAQGRFLQNLGARAVARREQKDLKSDVDPIPNSVVKVKWSSLLLTFYVISRLLS